MSGRAGSLYAENALTPSGWRRNVRLSWSDGVLVGVDADVAAQPGEPRASLALPGLANLHSHAFQRIFSGLTERLGGHRDTFWTWREAMYRHALTLSPEDVADVTALAFLEMLESGFTRVGEFHYLHNAPDGAPYQDIAELATRVAAAADETGIGLTLLPVFYAHSGFAGAAPAPEQRRFITSLDSFARLFDRAETIVAALDGGAVGVAPHSLRATTPDEIGALQRLAPGRPFHIHVAEQTAEVEASLATLGQRPVEYLLDHFAVGPNWCCIHATHMTDAEATRLAATGAVAGLCPVTEANLGDGLFNSRPFLDAGGTLGVGTDSNVRIAVAEELRMLEYAQRLARRERNVFASDGGSTARALVDRALAGGARALGMARAGLQVGADADIVVLSADPVDVCGDADEALAHWIFGRGVGVDRVFARGREVVRDGRHVARENIVQRFRGALGRQNARV